MEVKEGSLWKHKDDKEGLVVKYLGISKDINGAEVSVVGTLSEAGSSRVMSVAALRKYYDEVDDV
jgi:hypothetical protein